MLNNYLLELIKKTSTVLPNDVKLSVEKAYREESHETSKEILKTILDNIALAKEKQVPICQDTGTPTFHISIPRNYISESEIRRSIKSALKKATELAYLRPNAVDPINEINSGDNSGEGYPVCFFEETNESKLVIKLLLKGGGCENCSTQYSLPNTQIGANRDIKGIKKVIIHSVVQAQGKGCSPGILGVGIGGDRVSSYILSKKQLFRHLDDKNKDQILSDIEDDLLDKSNQLKIGAMGFGGDTTLLGLKVGKNHRLPASFFVSISYMCWACRRKSLTVDFSKDKQIKEYYIED